MLRFSEFMKHFSRSLASCRDRPLQITNNVRVQIAYEITDVTRHQTHRVVCLCLNMTPGEIKYVLFKMLYSLAAWLSGITTLLEWFEDLLAELARYGKGPGAIGTYLFQTGHEGKKNTTNASNNILFSFLDIFRPSWNLHMQFSELYS